MTIVADSYAARTAAQLDQLGAIGLVAYIGHVPNAINRQQHDALIHAGKDVSVIIEHTFDAWKLGYDKGHALGGEARTAATALGRPKDSAVGLAVDDNISPNQLHIALQHIAGFHAAAGRSWVYGTAFLIDRAFAAGLIEFGMQSCSTGFYDNKRVSAHSALHQHCHPDVDLNDVLANDWGQEPSPTLVPIHPAPAPTVRKDDNVIALVPNGQTKPHQSPYVDINYADKSHSIVAVFAAPFTEDPPKVTTADGVSVLHLEPGEVAVALAKLSENSILVVLADHTTRTVYINQQFSIA